MLKRTLAGFFVFALIGSSLLPAVGGLPAPVHAAPDEQRGGRGGGAQDTGNRGSAERSTEASNRSEEAQAQPRASDAQRQAQETQRQAQQEAQRQAQQEAQRQAEAAQRAQEAEQRQARQQAQEASRQAAQEATARQAAQEAADREARRGQQAAERAAQQAQEAAQREAQRAAQEAAQREAQRGQEAAQRAAQRQAEEAAERAAQRAAQQAAQAEAEKRAQAQAAERARAEAQAAAEAAARRQAEAEAAARQAAQQQAQQAQRQGRAAAGQQQASEEQKRGQEAAQRQAEEQRALAEAQQRARAEAQQRAQLEAQQRAQLEAQQRAQAEAQRLAREAAQRQGQARGSGQSVDPESARFAAAPLAPAPAEVASLNRVIQPVRNAAPTEDRLVRIGAPGALAQQPPAVLDGSPVGSVAPAVDPLTVTYTSSFGPFSESRVAASSSPAALAPAPTYLQAVPTVYSAVPTLYSPSIGTTTWTGGYYPALSYPRYTAPGMTPTLFGLAPTAAYGTTNPYYSGVNPYVGPSYGVVPPYYGGGVDPYAAYGSPNAEVYVNGVWYRAWELPTRLAYGGMPAYGAPYGSYAGAPPYYSPYANPYAATGFAYGPRVCGVTPYGSDVCAAGSLLGSYSYSARTAYGPYGLGSASGPFMYGGNSPFIHNVDLAAAPGPALSTVAPPPYLPGMPGYGPTGYLPGLPHVPASVPPPTASRPVSLVSRAFLDSVRFDSPSTMRISPLSFIRAPGGLPLDVTRLPILGSTSAPPMLDGAMIPVLQGMPATSAMGQPPLAPYGLGSMPAPYGLPGGPLQAPRVPVAPDLPESTLVSYGGASAMAGIAPMIAGTAPSAPQVGSQPGLAAPPAALPLDAGEVAGIMAAQPSLPAVAPESAEVSAVASGGTLPAQQLAGRLPTTGIAPSESGPGWPMQIAVGVLSILAGIGLWLSTIRSRARR